MTDKYSILAVAIKSTPTSFSPDNPTVLFTLMRDTEVSLGLKTAGMLFAEIWYAFAGKYTRTPGLYYGMKTKLNKGAVMEIHESRETTGVRPVRRISWGSVFAGTAIALAIGLLLAFLGFGVGIGQIDPAQEKVPFAGIATGYAIWWIISGIVALFFGGWVSGRLSTIRSKPDGMLNGLVVWAVVSILSLFLLTSTIGMVIGGAFTVVKTSLTTIGQAVGAAPGAVSAIAGQAGVSMNEVINEARAGIKDVAPGEQENIIQAIQAMLASPDTTLEESKKRVVELLTRNTQMSRQEAEQRVDRWIQTARQTIGKVPETAENIWQQTKEAVGATADALALASWMSFFMLLLGGVAAGLGGFLGTAPPRE